MPSEREKALEAARKAFEELANLPISVSLEDWNRISNTILVALATPADDSKPVAWLDETGRELHKFITAHRKQDMADSGGRQAERSLNYSVPLYPHPSPSISDEMVERAAAAIQDEGPIGCCSIEDEKAKDLARAALEAALSAAPKGGK